MVSNTGIIAGGVHLEDLSHEFQILQGLEEVPNFNKVPIPILDSKTYWRKRELVNLPEIRSKPNVLANMNEHPDGRSGS